ncbi:hypothetical protein SJAV_13290 [Sulfurisphaera javensis]|uniref:Uncharacterized protein n=1 Tax=Sulfurisphaera javensis TaxID=2049879 RepID=A0AAT9GR18_9CREN
MAKIEIEGDEMVESCEVDKDHGEYYPVCYNTEFDVDVEDIEFSDDEIERIVRDNVDEVARILAYDNKLFNEIVQKVLKIKERRAISEKRHMKP